MVFGTGYCNAQFRRLAVGPQPRFPGLPNNPKGLLVMVCSCLFPVFTLSSRMVLTTLAINFYSNTTARTTSVLQ